MFSIKALDGFTIGLLQLVLHLVWVYTGGQESEYCLALDRTNWKLGRLHINILVVGLVLANGKFIPLYFKLLGKAGNSNQGERIDLMRKLDWFFESFGKQAVVLLGDREFIGQSWFYYLLGCCFDFVIRIRRKDYFADLVRQLKSTDKRVHKKIAKSIKRRGYFVAPIELMGKTFYYHVRLNDKPNHKDKDPYIRFISTSIDHDWVIQQYDKRWKIEVFFEDCKSKGFDLEAINFKDLGKIRLMVAICSLCYVLCLIEGWIQFEKRPPRQKFDKKTKKFYSVVSVFTKGYETIEQIVINLQQLARYINNKIIGHPPIIQHIIAKRLYLF